MTALDLLLILTLAGLVVRFLVCTAMPAPRRRSVPMAITVRKRGPR